MAVTAAITVAIVLAGACLFGVGVLTTFGTDLNAFRVGGGLIVVLTGIGWQPMQDRQTPASVVPLMAYPLALFRWPCR